MIETLKLEKSYGYRQVLRGITLTIPAGQVVALAGPNGAGKSTLMRIIATLARPTRGRVAVNGIEIPHGAMEARGSIGYVGHQTLLYDDLTVEENLRFYGELYDLPDLSARIRTVAQQVSIDKRLGDVVRTLSRGYQQRASLARALLNAPRVYLYDEPWTGLDQNSSGLLTDIFAAARQSGAAVLFATHEFERSLGSADRALILRGGRIMYDGVREDWRDAVRFGEIYAEAMEAMSRKGDIASNRTGGQG